MHRTLSALLLLAACDDGDSSDDGDFANSGTTCALEAALTGAVDATLSYDEASGCSGSGYDDSASFSFGINESVTLLLWLNAGVDITQTSQSGLAATVGVIDGDFTEWQSDSDVCTVDLTLIEPGEWEGDYRFVGEGSCPAALLDDEGNAVEVSAFSFAGVAPM